jgi:glycosyltransferase involved in cell wall biosynthesis
MILQVVPNINPSIGGPAVSVVRLSLDLHHSGHSVKLACLNYPEHGALPELPSDMLHALDSNTLTKALRGLSAPLRARIDQLATDSTLIHNHGIWMFPNHYAAAAARQHHKPLITSPRGMLGSWALSYHSFPKKILWHLREKHDLHSVTAFHATSHAEARDIRRLGFSQPIAVIPNGVDIPNQPLLDRAILENKIPQLKTKRLALFLSRIHPKKGVLELVDAWATLPQELRQTWLLVIAGPDLTNHLPQVQSRIHSHQLNDSIQLHPPVSGSLKHALLDQAELFVLPSHEENFGIVVAEALAHGTPVIATHGTPWEMLSTDRCGWWIPLSVETLGQTLQSALQLSSTDLSTMGQRGQATVAQHFSWPALAQKMASFYTWILQGGSTPSFVEKN